MVHENEAVSSQCRRYDDVAKESSIRLTSPVNVQVVGFYDGEGRGKRNTIPR